MKRIVIVDDHFLLRAGWSYLIDPQEDLAICGAAGSVSEALEIIEKTSPDLVITDLSLPGRSGLELIKDLKALHPGLPVLVVSMHDETIYAERVIKAGGRGYLMKEAAQWHTRSRTAKSAILRKLHPEKLLLRSAFPAARLQGLRRQGRTRPDRLIPAFVYVRTPRQ